MYWLLSLKLLQNFRVFLNFDKVHNPLCLARKGTSEREKMVSHVFDTFDLDMCFALHMRALLPHVNFQSGPNLVCFGHFDLDICFGPQWCALRTSQLPKVVRYCGVLCSTFSTSQLLEVLRSWGALYILTWKCVSRHSGVQPFISYLARWLRTRRLSEPTFRPSRATNHWKKHSKWRNPYLFADLPFFFLSLFSDLLTSFLLLSDSFDLCFPICPHCRKFNF